ncbi:hypothetical protein SETIT_9G529600v2 [Setaria italica]|uniref:Uncharacterized protein n=1 Tax=Setaria italica TaxID=4555 RepID=A0A368SVJ1_SETIT|nr:hypothetical protein SETIT_9G529600v2 [Setaria italica]
MLTAQEYLDKMCLPLMIVALILTRAPFLAAGKPLAGAARETAGEQHLRDTNFQLCNKVTSLALYIVVFLWMHAMRMTASARRTLAGVVAMFAGVFLSMAMAYSVESTNDLSEATVAFLAAVGIMAVVVVLILCKLMILCKGAAVFLVAAAIASVGAHLWRTGERGLGAALNLLLLAAMSAGSSLDLDGWMGGMDDYYISSWRYVSSGVYGTVRD